MVLGGNRVRSGKYRKVRHRLFQLYNIGGIVKLIQIRHAVHHKYFSELLTIISLLFLALLLIGIFF